MHSVQKSPKKVSSSSLSPLFNMNKNLSWNFKFRQKDQLGTFLAIFEHCALDFFFYWCQEYIKTLYNPRVSPRVPPIRILGRKGPIWVKLMETEKTAVKSNLLGDNSHEVSNGFVTAKGRNLLQFGSKSCPYCCFAINQMLTTTKILK